MRRRAGLLVFSVILVPIVAVGQVASHKYQHPGTIVNAYSHKGILADAHAYGSDSPNGGSTTCPVYSNLLDTQKSSSATGAFIFHIDQQISGYIATYCEQGYAPRTETTNDNLTDNTRVQPDPITLYPISLPGIPSAKIATVAIGTDIEGLHANLSYYQKANSAAFDDALSSPGFSGQDRLIISAVMQERKSFSAQGAQVEGWRPQTSVENSKVTFVAMVADLNHARSDFVYYARSDERGYFDALHSAFPVDEGKVIEEIRTRSEPFGRIQKSFAPPEVEHRVTVANSKPSSSFAQVDGDVLAGAKLGSGFDVGVNTSEGRHDWLSVNREERHWKLAYPSGQYWGAVFITVGKPTAPPRPGRDFSGYEALSIEMKAGTDTNTISIGIKSSTQPDDGSEKKMSFKVVPEWKTYKFPLTRFEGTDLRNLYVVAEFLFEDSNAQTVYVRNIKYLVP